MLEQFLAFCLHYLLTVMFVYQQMDVERRRNEARDPKRQPRLMEEDDMPTWLLRDEAEVNQSD